jgi:hypothetical protein
MSTSLDRVALPAIIGAAMGDLNGSDFVSRDVEWAKKNGVRSRSWMGCAVKRDEGAYPSYVRILAAHFARGFQSRCPS